MENACLKKLKALVQNNETSHKACPVKATVTAMWWRKASFSILKSEFIYFKEFGASNISKKDQHSILILYNHKRIKIKLKGMKPGTIPESCQSNCFMRF
ncbi:IS3 family transposase [Bacillus paralicheniformis]|uniref:IS3 family transposase n=2 Tax=Bacillus paralicheniformis TaxID=1648923 RepID=UPI0034E396BF